jgi:hypothetical protein
MGAMNKGYPINVADMTPSAGSNKPDRYNRILLPIYIAVLPSIQFVQMN